MSVEGTDSTATSSMPMSMAYRTQARRSAAPTQRQVRPRATSGDSFGQQAMENRPGMFASIASENAADYNTLIQNAGYDAFQILAYNPEYQFLDQFAKSSGALTGAYTGVEIAQVQASQAINLMEYIDFMEGWESSPEGQAWMSDAANVNTPHPTLIAKAEELGLRLGEGPEGTKAFVDAAWSFTRADAYRMMDQAQRKMALKEFMIQMLQKYYDESMKSVSSESAIRLASSG